MNNLSATEVNIALLSLGGLVMVLGLFSGYFKERLWLSNPILALGLGVLLGPLVTGLINLEHWGKPEAILEQGARLTIAIQLMGIGLRLPRKYPWHKWRILAVFLGLVMPIMWLCSGLLVYFIFGLPFWEAMLVGAVITPTDPVVAMSVVTGKVAEANLPKHLRNAITVESAANDGLAYPLAFLAILMLNKSPEQAIFEWLTRVWLWEVLAAVLIGALIGYIAGKILVCAESKNTIEKQSFLAYSVSLSLAVLAFVKLIGSDGILAVFAAAITFNIVIGGQERAEEESVQEAIDRFFTVYIFVLLGLALPWQQWLALGWKGLLIVIAILLLRRLPAFLLLRPLLGRLKSWHNVLFVGWFGPIGVAAIFYAMLALRHTGLELPWVIGSLVICGSIIVHGSTAVPFTQFYGEHFGKKPGISKLSQYVE